MGEHMKRCPFLNSRVEEEGSSITPSTVAPSGSKSMWVGQDHYASASSISSIEEANIDTKLNEHNSCEPDDDDVAFSLIHNYQNHRINLDARDFAKVK